MNIIVAVDKNWAIGSKGDQIVVIPFDRQLFREETTGKVVVMGRKTLKTFPSGLPLMNRTNIILSRDKSFTMKDAIVTHSVEETLEVLKQYNSEDIYIVGGESIYEAFLPYCDTAHVTKIDYAYEADTHFPNLDNMSEWVITEESEEQTYFDLIYYFMKYNKME